MGALQLILVFAFALLLGLAGVVTIAVEMLQEGEGQGDVKELGNEDTLHQNTLNQDAGFPQRELRSRKSLI